ncbi:MAG: RuBisCO large subunit C-terminal-like domain-containing protein [Candidatus Heimdallarchaeota archaeon]
MHGAQAIRQAVEVIQQGIPLATYAESHPELQKAIEFWSKP